MRFWSRPISSRPVEDQILVIHVRFEDQTVFDQIESDLASEVSYPCHQMSFFPLAEVQCGMRPCWLEDCVARSSDSLWLWRPRLRTLRRKHLRSWLKLRLEMPWRRLTRQPKLRSDANDQIPLDQTKIRPGGPNQPTSPLEAWPDKWYLA